MYIITKTKKGYRKYVNKENIKHSKKTEKIEKEEENMWQVENKQ